MEIDDKTWPFAYGLAPGKAFKCKDGDFWIRVAPKGTNNLVAIRLSDGKRGRSEDFASPVTPVHARLVIE